MTTYVTKTISSDTSADQFSDTTFLDGDFSLSISGAIGGSGIVTVQRSTDGGTTFHDVDTFTAIGEHVGFEPTPSTAYRVGMKNGQYASGTTVLQLSGPISPART
tara:strand:+ start:289 stop:603 length:315 start_codon:yes stop_codon:yes gene_type:complete